MPPVPNPKNSGITAREYARDAEDAEKTSFRGPFQFAQPVNFVDAMKAKDIWPISVFSPRPPRL